MATGTIVWAQEEPDTVFFSSNGWKIERYYSGPGEYREKCYTNDGMNLYWQGCVIDGRYVGTWMYYDRGLLKMKASNFSHKPIAPPIPTKGILFAPNNCYVEQYYPNGQKSGEGTCLFFDSPEEEGSYEIGQWIFYNADGSIAETKEISVPCIQDFGTDSIVCNKKTFSGKVLFRNAQDQCLEAIESNDSICIVSADNSFFEEGPEAVLFIGMRMTEFRQKIDFCMPKAYSTIIFAHPSSITDNSHEDLKGSSNNAQSAQIVYITICDEQIKELNYGKK